MDHHVLARPRKDSPVGSEGLERCTLHKTKNSLDEGPVK